ncbi:ArsR family transcriptional regulator [Kiloniella spongiae]|uniref:ArsR family transcriptional regulator n=1 Tax=Kiloniella spongiae TaxID=1489064 RepID=A0A0H2MBQ9_9PROT|nr:Lrp/AsnC family transcriptional regulator [Kiloniella spongiae]KLN59641.1 ArsR family transcriptional regulator [Kiloniella spongiae]
MKIDNFDKAILRLLQENSRLKSDSIAEQVGLSATACQRRIKRLRDMGAIEREVAVINPDVSAHNLTLIVQLVIERCDAKILKALTTQFLGEPEIQQCYNVTGSFDFLLIVTAENMTTYDKFTKRVFFDNPAIQEFTTTVVMENVKRGLELPIT